MVSSNSPPTPPDPTKTAAAQTQMNKDTAVAQYGLNATNQVTPQGNLSYSQIGTWGDGTPRFQATTSYSPEQQNLYNLGTKTQTNLGNIGVSQSQKIGDLLNTPFKIDDATDSKIGQLQKGFLDPQWQRQQDAMETQLINKGIAPGSEQYKNAQTDFSNQRQKAYDQSYLDIHNTAQQSALTERNQPINEISALLSGSQVSQPNYANTPSAGIAPTDYIGAVGQNYQAQLQNYNTQQQQKNAMMGGLFGLGSAGLGGWAYGGFK